MPHEPDVWTGEVRRTLYKQLAKKFGPLDTWHGSNSPGGGRDAEFIQFCEDFARVVGAKSGRAVQHQIRFAMPESAAGSNWEDGQVQTAILNKAAALEAGFIENRHLPNNLHAVGRGVLIEDLI